MLSSKSKPEFICNTLWPSMWEDIQFSITFSINLEKFGHSKIGLYSLQDQAPQTKRQE